MNSSESIKELASALARAQAKMKTAEKVAVNAFHKSKYADLAGVWDACREALTSEGLSVMQGLERWEDGSWCLETAMMHTSGEYMCYDTPLFLPSPANMQHLGSAVTYAKRISLMAIAGISVGEVDDDGEENRKSLEQPKEPSQNDRVMAEFRNLIANQREIVAKAGIADKLMDYGRIRIAKNGMTANEFIKTCLNDPEVFLDDYREFLKESK